MRQAIPCLCGKEGFWSGHCASNGEVGRCGNHCGNGPKGFSRPEVGGFGGGGALPTVLIVMELVYLCPS